jgi:hypothetical protein
MAEVIRVFDGSLIGPDGRQYSGWVWGSERPDGRWEGWLEFHDGSTVARTDRETTQSNRAGLVYWAGGLTSVYAQGALSRAIRVDP